LAKEAGVEAAETSVIETGKKYHALLSKRFDRTVEGRRKHFASAMTLLGLTDGCDAKSGNGYLDIVDFILQNCCDVEQNLRQLYRRVAFNIAIGNSDDHFRNHGFLLTPRGWTLSPAYDMNPTLNEYQALLINSTTNHADLQVLLDSSEEYMIGKDEAVYIIEEVKAGVKHWKSIATRLGIAKREMDVFEQVFQRSLK
jgi:serine/threonine-protein kinase HipA